LDEPISDTAFITTYLVSQFARRDVTVILSGVGGDELFGGYRRYLGDHYQAYYGRLPAWLRRAAASAGRRLPSDRHSGLLNLSRLAKGFLESADLPFEARYRAYVEVFSAEEVGGLLMTGGKSHSDPIAEAFDEAHGTDPLHRMLIVDAATQLPDDLLLLTDKMSMATSLECRVPLLDHELVELAARMPQEIKIRGGRPSTRSRRRWPTCCRAISSSARNADSVHRWEHGSSAISRPLSNSCSRMRRSSAAASSMRER
jgi:asparagine synthase (glutamine-hydrolysing)